MNKCSRIKDGSLYVEENNGLKSPFSFGLSCTTKSSLWTIYGEEDSQNLLDVFHAKCRKSPSITFSTLANIPPSSRNVGNIYS